MAVKPLTGQAFVLLAALADGPRHGYGIVGEVGWRWTERRARALPEVG